MIFKKFLQNGKILPIKKASIQLVNIEYQYGFGVYESVRVLENIPYFLELHIERLFNSARIIQLEHFFSKQSILTSVKDLIAELKINSAYNLKILLIGGKTKDDAILNVIPLAPLFPDRKMYKEGASIITEKYERLFPKAKTLSMLKSYLAYKKAKEKNCYEALAIDRDSCIREGTRSNFFLIKDKTIFSPPGGKLLDGVTRKIVLSIVAKNSYSVKEKDLRLSELSEYDGAFLTSTSFKVLPIKKIDDFVFPEITQEIKELIRLYSEYLKKCKGIFRG